MMDKIKRNEYMRKYYKTKKGLIKLIYQHQKRSIIKFGSIGYTVDILTEWILSQNKFHQFYDEWVICEYDKMKTPSIDRLDDYKGYSLGNIRITIWEENKNKAHKDRFNGVNNKDSLAVLQFDKQGNFIAEYYSQHDASRKTGVNQGNLCQACLGKAYKSAGGFIWKYK